MTFKAHTKVIHNRPTEANALETNRN